VVEPKLWERSLEGIDKDLDRLIEKRNRGRDEANAIANAWRMSEAKRKRERREANKREWCSYMLHLANYHRKRADELDHERAQLLRISAW